MMLKNDNLYTPLAEHCRNMQEERGEENSFRALAEFVIPTDYYGFSGHFPNKPVLPAIVQLAAVRYLAEQVAQHPLLPGHYRKIKFKGMIQPMDAFVVRLRLVSSSLGYCSEFFIERREGAILTEGIADFKLS